MPYLARVERAHIVNLSSLFGVIGMAGQSAYCTTKFAVRGLSESLWEELRATSIGLTVVHPGSVATNIMDSAEGDDLELLERVSCWFERNAIPPQRAAAQIIAAVQKGHARLLITKEARFADFVKRLFPVIGNKLIGDAVIRKIGLGDMREKRQIQWLKTMVEDDSCE
jgi:short-subunit dehydrogenase